MKPPNITQRKFAISRKMYEELQFPQANKANSKQLGELETQKTITPIRTKVIDRIFTKK